ncbi:pantoate--beta-alanine ligase [Desulfogranum mediterraneum]|uniref:pantoate--beta-alanine ligase n=1 Tax=Desulfogranum mediterraneum TaxID=160661 RepID=UPI0003FC316C|nr:pantoate--beta-alanine ligase [Desulfogranum mediterraneum]
MKIITTPEEMRTWAEARLQEGRSIGLVPTMGYFHEGHLSLMRRAHQSADLVVVSLFVNPTQFGPNEDLDRYPRSMERDVSLAEKEGVAVVFAPSNEQMYPQGFQTVIRVEPLATHLCGVNRPVHFSGVATVVTKLFNLIRPTLAVFGEKDYQQLAIIRRLVADLNMTTKVIGHPIVREADGLAMSSRNANLPEGSRDAALSLSASIKLARQAVARGVRSTRELNTLIREHISSFADTRIDYVSFVDGDTLEAADEVDQRTVLALAVHIAERARLIDNGFLVSGSF